MHLVGRLAALTILITNGVPGIIASPVDQSPNENAVLVDRAAPMIQNQRCSNPAQISLRNEPTELGLGHCGWKLWIACTALAGGVCLVPCLDGAFADPACDACLVAMGTLGCKACITDNDLQDSFLKEMVRVQPRVAARLQKDYCEVPKKTVPLIQLPQNGSLEGAAVSNVAAGQPSNVPTS